VDDCVFCGIVAGALPAHEVWRSPEAVAFLDRSPVFEGHVLVVPPAHHETLTDLPAAELEPFFAVVQRVAGALPEALGCTGTFVAMNNVVSQSVPHLHVHVVPRTKGDGLRGFFWPRRRYRDEDHAAEVAAVVAGTLDATV
jgi:histidine triad (HIT) family protein